MANYRRPGVYIEESLSVGSADISSANAVTVFAGAAPKGPTVAPARIDTWNDYVTLFGGFQPPLDEEGNKYRSFLPYAVYSYFQNGGRGANIIRCTGSTGQEASVSVTDGEDNAFTLQAISEGSWGNDFSVQAFTQVTSGDPASYVFGLMLLKGNAVVESFNSLSLTGDIPGTKRVDVALNDEIYGSAYLRVTSLDESVVPNNDVYTLTGGSDGGMPDASHIQTAGMQAVGAVLGPILVNLVGYENLDGEFVAPSRLDPTQVPDRTDVFVINDGVAPRGPMETSAEYASSKLETGALVTGTSSFEASYAPWIVVPDPAVSGGTITIPPGGAVAGVFSRTDATSGPFHSPAGVGATISNAIGVDAKFSETDLGRLNSQSRVNIIRPVTGSGISIMGGRTRKPFGYDRYVSARRTLIYIRESLRRSTEQYVFQNNDQRLWTQLSSTADRILRPIWMAGGLAGVAASDSYYVICDESINTPQVIQQGEVRMEVGVALTAPAEFIVIRIAQFESGSTEITIS